MEKHAPEVLAAAAKYQSSKEDELDAQALSMCLSQSLSQDRWIEGGDTCGVANDILSRASDPGDSDETLTNSTVRRNVRQKCINQTKAQQRREHGQRKMTRSNNILVS